VSVPQRVMFVQLKTGHDIDKGPAWISMVRFTSTGWTAYWHGRTLRRWPGLFDANFVDVETDEEYWISGPHRDRRDTRYSAVEPTIDEDARDAYQAFLDGASLPGRERGCPGRAVRFRANRLSLEPMTSE
jgi:hypothetical protein